MGCYARSNHNNFEIDYLFLENRYTVRETRAPQLMKAKVFT